MSAVWRMRRTHGKSPQVLQNQRYNYVVLFAYQNSLSYDVPDLTHTHTDKPPFEKNEQK